MTEIPIKIEKSKIETIRADARATARRDDLLKDKKEAIRKQTHFLIAFFFRVVRRHLAGKVPSLIVQALWGTPH